MFRILSLVAIVVSLLGASGDVKAQTAPELNLENSGSMGYIPSVTRPITSNHVNDLGVSTATIDDNRVFNVMGCGVLDTHEARRIVLEESQGQIEQYFDSSVSNYMVSTLYNSPALAEIFNGLENFSGTRVRELQDRCATMEYKDDLAPAQWEAVQRCISMNLEGADLIATSSPAAIAKAFNECLSSPLDANAPVATLAAATMEVLSGDDSKWNGSLFSALQNTRVCVDTSNNLKDCSLMTFLPNVRWCTLSNKATFKECASANASDPSTGPAIPTSVSAQGITEDAIISPEKISPMQIFDAVFGLTESFVNYAYVFADTLVEGSDYESAMKVAREGENTNTGYHMSAVATREQMLAGDWTAGLERGDGAMEIPFVIDGAMRQFVNCDVPMVNDIPEWEDFSRIINVDLINPHAAVAGRLPPRPNGVVHQGDFFHNDMTTDTTTMANPSDSTLLTDSISTSEALAVIDAATKCAMRNELRLALTDYISLTQEKRSGVRDAALLGYRTQVAYAVTRNILNFVIHRLDLAKLDLALNVSSDPNSPPPHVRKAVDTIISSLKNRLDALEQKREHQKDYAQMINNFHKGG